VSEPARKHLPLLENDARYARRSSLRKDGSRVKVVPADVSGRFQTARKAVFALLIVVWAALPWIQIGGHPSVQLDVAARRFYLFGKVFNAQDTWLVFFLLTGAVFGLLYVTALAGRVWCGWACPQTVFLEGIFRPIERLIGGPREKRMRRAAGPWTAERVLRGGAIRLFWLLAALFVAHVFLGYFVSLPRLFVMVREKPADNYEPFLWMVALTVLFYIDFAWFREQLCLVVCPYGRMQSVLFDSDTLVVGYDETRGEPRAKGKAKAEGKGDCVDCNRCVIVCPTGIDIRNGIQVDCIACTQCIDACDAIMDKLDRPRGLIRYDSLAGLQHKPKRILRPRIYFYTALMCVGAAVATFAFSKRTSFEANLLRLPGAPYVVEDGKVRNSFEIHLVNKRGETTTFVIEPVESPNVELVTPATRVELGSFESRRIPIFAVQPEAHAASKMLTVRVRAVGGEQEVAREVKALLLAPSGARP
jgi:cytochrome c oxidase accessory protein FixG